MPNDEMIIDVAKEISKVDSFVTKLIHNKRLQEVFFKNPVGTMIKLGVSPPTSDNAVKVSNRIFYSLLSNKRLINFITKNRINIRIPKNQKEFFLKNLGKNKIQHDLGTDILGLNNYLKNEKLLKKLLTLTLNDLNEKGLLIKKFESHSVQNYVEQILIHLREGTIKNVPALVKYSRNYGIGSKIDPGTIFAESEVDSGVDTGADATTSVNTTASGGGGGGGTNIQTGGGTTVMGDNAAGASTGTSSETLVEVTAAVSDFVVVTVFAGVFVGVELLAAVTVAHPTRIEDIENPQLVEKEIVDLGFMKPEDLRSVALKDIAAAQTLSRLFSFVNDLALFIENIDQKEYFGKQ